MSNAKTYLRWSLFFLANCLFAALHGYVLRSSADWLWLLLTVPLHLIALFSFPYNILSPKS